MNALAAEWAEKAEADYWTAGRELRARMHPNWDAVCFHAQQCAEKYLKAFLQQQAIAPPRTHSLIELLEACLPLDSSFAPQRSRLISLIATPSPIGIPAPRPTGMRRARRTGLSPACERSYVKS